ncbi:DUF72 domain-containing protein [Rubripirellula reticaptiva]|uniref:DUF72 domain-containing protein n=1 Tax=Rubripirellula reticaptiva TaxID=2528013 RepID=A0A5C6FB58_9BACT|nr:DUF72 domain-containing protein [Rubripirellula reticaptiva]TWU57544.1 hypothetical protein Poly59_04510 [Rubripirellula reticaptiva]
MSRPESDLPFFLGCPVWNCPHWAGQIYPPRTPRSDWLNWYTRTFNTVEGNSTFYALPTIETSKRWADEAANGFRFSFKFPRTVSHELALHKTDREAAAFFDCLRPLADADRLGPTFLQLGPSFGPDRFDVLERFLRRLPTEWSWALELRHADWFDESVHERRVDDLLRSMQIDKVLFDSRPLYQSPPDDHIEAVSQTRKPRTPIRQTVTGRSPMLRIVGRNRPAMADAFFDEWAPTVAQWIRDGLCPYVFTHAPDDTRAPELARRFAARMAIEMPELTFDIASPPMPPRQMSLLDE